MRENTFWLLISVFLSPFIMAEESSCPVNIDAALKSIEQHLKNKQWVYIYHDDCPQIQAELIAKADQIVKAKNFENYIPLMSKDTMRIIRNTFFAVKGHEFQDNSLKEHFQKYSWYKPVNGKNIILSEVENRYVDFLKNIEDSLSPICESELRCRKPPSLPENVKIIEKGDRTLLRFRTNTIDITPHGQEWSRDRYPIFPIPSLNSILVCEQKFHGSSPHIYKMWMYSNDGKEMYSYKDRSDDRMLGFGECPFWIHEYPGVLFSHNFKGGGGTLWNILILFNTKLEPVTIVNCNEDGCGGTNLFDVLNKAEIYFFIGATGTKFSEEKFKENGSYFWYGEDSDSFIYNIWFVQQNGNMELVAEAKKNCKRINGTQSGYDIECEKPEPIVDIFRMAKNRGNWGRIITSLRFEDKLLLFQKDSSWGYATSVIPLIRK